MKLDRAHGRAKGKDKPQRVIRHHTVDGRRTVVDNTGGCQRQRLGHRCSRFAERSARLRQINGYAVRIHVNRTAAVGEKRNPRADSGSAIRCSARRCRTSTE